MTQALEEAKFLVIAGALILNEGKKSTPVRLVDLRKTVHMVPRERLDRALVELAVEGAITLRQGDDAELRPEEHEAAVLMGGTTWHTLLCHEGRGCCHPPSLEGWRKA